MSFATSISIPVFSPQPPGYSSASDVETTNNLTDFSETEAGYSSTTSTGFEYITNSGFQRIGNVPLYASHQYSNSKSPPTSFGSPPGSASTSTAGASTPTSPDPNAGSQGQTTYQRIARFVGPPPVPLACTECRARHLKCDAGKPVCSRCKTDARECNYVKSRRGWKGTRRKKVAAAVASASDGKASPATPQEGTATSAPAPASPALSTAASATSAVRRNNARPAPPVPTANFSPPPPGPQTNPLSTLRAHQKNSTYFGSLQEPAQLTGPTVNLVQLYYEYFHPSHPFVLPPAYLIKTTAVQLKTLFSTMRYIASFFAPNAPRSTFQREAEQSLFDVRSPPPRNSFTVQALLLFSIGLFAENEQDRASQVKDIAAELAVEIGMNHKEFSETAGDDENARVLAESWRRTWWELYFIDGMMAGIQQRESFQLWSVECTVPLPCEEETYAKGDIPIPQSLQDFDDRYFAASKTVFSSFSYRVEAMRILGQVLAVGSGSGGPEEETRIEAAEASIVNWGLHLPEPKKNLKCSRERKVDEMLFQAHLIINAAIIYLNRPKSHLNLPLQSPDDAAASTPATTAWPTSTKSPELYTARTLAAANTISKLITLPTPLICHTSFFSHFISLASIVHLSACSWLLSGDEAFLAKERIRLGAGALKVLEGTWPCAGPVGRGVQECAREVFREEEVGEEVLALLQEEGEWRDGVEGWGGVEVGWNGSWDR